MPRPARAAGFFGLHFDFHCKKDTPRVGGRTTPAMIRAVLSATRPDHVQIDCKGHPGISSYPTAVGHPADHLIGDPLAVWRSETAKTAVPLTMHYSGVWDMEALRRHPTWACRNREGKLDERFVSVFGPYADALMIPQLVELAREWMVDAVWVDGDCWSVQLDWSRWSLAAWRRSGHRGALPTRPEERSWQAFVDHCRDGYRAFLRRYVDAAHAARPAFEVASNWSFSSHMPEPVSAAVDFLSGDFSPVQSVQSARLQARCLMGQGKPWDLMAWGFGVNFENNGGHCDKSALQLCQEAALVLGLGGGFQIYTAQQKDGFVPRARQLELAAVARFCRAREALCHRATPVGQVGVLYSHEDWRLRSGAPFPGSWPGLQQLEGILRLCLDTRRHCEVILDHQLDQRLADLRVLVLPECRHLAPAVRRRLLAWVRAGGRILAIGPHAVAALDAGLPLRPAAEPVEAIRYLRSPERRAGAGSTAVKGDWMPWRTGRGARVLTALHETDDGESRTWPGAVSCRLGRGRVVAVAIEMGRAYRERCSSVATALMAQWLRHLDPRPLVEIDGPGRIEVACMRKDGRLRIHLSSLEGPHDASNVVAWDHIPPIGPLTARIRVPGRGSVRWEPDGIRLRARRDRDGVVVTVPGFALHGALCLTS